MLSFDRGASGCGQRAGAVGAVRGWLLAGLLLLAGVNIGRDAAAQVNAATDVSHTAAGVPFSSEQINALLPQAVYFQGKTAPLQLRNAAGTRFGNGEILWASLVDTSGYATSVQDKYQFYLVTEGPVRFGSAQLPAGAYGAGFVKDGFLLMDLGGHTLAEGPVQVDATLARPRPLQLVRGSANAVKLYLGRRWVLLTADPSAGASK